MRLPDDPISVVEAAYDLGADEQSWLTRIAREASASLDAGFGVAAHRFDASDPARFSWTEPVVVGAAKPRADGPGGALAGSMLSLLFGDGPALVTASEQTGLGAAFASWGPAAPFREQFGAADVLALKVSDPTRRGLVLLALLPEVRAVSEPARAAWSRLAAHLAAAARLRRALSSDPDAPEAVLDEDARVVHAEGPARSSSAREALRGAVRDQHRARGALRRLDPGEALAAWRGLVAGRWSVVESFDTDGRRFLVARRNDPDVPPDPRGLVLRERQVLGYLALGYSVREIAYAVGLAPSTVSEHVSRGLRKLGIASRAEAVRLLGTPPTPPER